MHEASVSRKSFLKTIFLGALALTFIPRLLGAPRPSVQASSLPLKASKEPRAVPNRISPRSSTTA